MKEIVFVGDSLEVMRAFPLSIKQRAGYELHKVQNGIMPGDFKWMPVIGSGVLEIRLRDGSGQFRVIYTAKIGDVIHVLHAFQKTTQKTSPQDLALAQQRYKALLQGE